MAILIDGYNLLNATGIDGRGTAGRTELERSRKALLNFLARNLADDERALTTIVFDAAQAPPGLPSEMGHAEMHVRFARGYPTADDLIEELIAADHAPRQLVVVSSDHRLHRAARRRRATAVDSDHWMSQLETRRGRAAEMPSRLPTEETSIDAHEATNWLAEFGDVNVDAIQAEITDEPPGDAASQDAIADAAAPPPKRGPRPREDVGISPAEFFADANDIDQASVDDWNPFPPGYGADVDDED